MKIERIHVENFKSFDLLDLELNNQNIIIGPNSSGKSNLVAIFKFLDDICHYGVSDAISLQGGVKFLRNTKIGSDKKTTVSFEASFEQNDDNYFRFSEKIQCVRMTYDFTIRTYKSVEKFVIEKQSMFLEYIISNERNETNGELSSIIFNKGTGAIDIKYSDNFDSSLRKLLGRKYMMSRFKTKNESLLFILRYGFIMPEIDFRFFDFDTKTMKSPSSILSKGRMEENGANLVNVINEIVKSKKKKERFINLVQLALPQVSDIKVEKGSNKLLEFMISESYSNGSFPSSLLSDGTINIIAIIIALYFDTEQNIIFLEEPEKNIHPKLLSSVRELINNYSGSQVFVTTHNPQLIRNVDLDNLLLLKRDKEGYTRIEKPNANKTIQAFLNNDLGIEDLFVEGLLNE